MFPSNNRIVCFKDEILFRFCRMGRVGPEMGRRSETLL